MMVLMNTLITGVAGSGKTTIAAELTKQGYDARNMDDIEGLCSWIDLETGKPNPHFERESADDWVDTYDWWWDENKLRRLLGETASTFFCGSSGNQDKYYHLFDKVFLLETDDELIRERVLHSERDHDYGRMPGELEAILGYYKDFQNKAKKFGATVIDAHKPVADIVSIILSESGIQPRYHPR